MIHILTHKLKQSGYHTSLAIMALRTLTLGAKFLLTLFLARYLGLAELGAYGLVSGIVAFAPVLVSAGMQNALSRDMVGSETEDLIGRLKAYWWLIGTLYALTLLALPVVACVAPQHLTIIILTYLVIVAEHVSQDVYNYYVSQHKQLTANILLFIKTAAWVLVYIAVAFAVPEMRTIPMLLLFWLIGNLPPLAYFAYTTRAWPWASVATERFNFRQMYKARYLFISDVAFALGQYSDRYLITFFMGLEAAGIYVFFWQIASAVSGLVNTGVLQMYKPRLIKAHKQNDAQTFAHQMKLASINSLSTVTVLAVTIGGVMLVLLPYIKPELVPYETVMALVLFGTLTRVVAALVGFTLYARNKDIQYAAVAAFTVFVSMGMNAVVLSLGMGLIAVCLVNIGVSLATILLRLRA